MGKRFHREPVKYRCEDLAYEPLEQLYYSLTAHHIKGRERKIYEQYVRQAKEMAQRGRITGTVEIRLSGIYDAKGIHYN